MNKIAISGLLICLVAWLGCRGDAKIVAPPPLSLIGNYEGIYSYTEINSVADTIVDTSQLVNFRFTNDIFLMTRHANIAESLRVFCDIEGIYELDENGVQVTITRPHLDYYCGISTGNPFGTFTLDITADTIRMRHDSTGDIGIQIIKLIRMLSAN